MAQAQFVRFTPDTVESRRTMRGHAQLKSRGVVTTATTAYFRSMVAYGRLHDELKPHIITGRSVLLKGYWERVRNADGSMGGEFFKPFAYIRSFDDPETHPEAVNDNARTVAGHARKSHERRIRCKVTGEVIKVVLVKACRVKGGQRAG